MDTPPKADPSRRAYLLLVLTTLMWGGNSVAGRLAVGEVSPMAITCLRWLGVCLVLAVVAPHRLIADWPLLKPKLWLIGLMGIFGYTAFNALFYLGAHYTGAINISIIQGSIPAFVFLFAFMIHRTPVRLTQALGTMVTLAGVAMVASRGHLSTLLELDFNIGDLMLLIACLFYAVYTVALRSRPPASDIGFFTIMAIAAFLTSLPLVAIEYASGSFQAPTLKGWLLILFITLCPSLLSQLFYMRAVSLIGPGRAGIFANLVPVFGPAMAVVVLGEPFGWHHAVALVLVVGGVVWAQRR